MRIAYVSAGAANMFCGSCLHDNTLVAALQRLGHDAVLMPTYTRLRTDEPDVSLGRVFFGALNVYLEQVAAPVRRGPALLARLLDRPALIALVSRLGAATDPAGLGELTLSILRGEEGNQAAELDQLVGWLRDSFRPDVVHLTNSMFAGFARRLKAELGVPVVCSVQGEELFLDALHEPSRAAVLAELRRRAGDVDLFIAPNRFYADLMASYLRVERGRIAVVPLGLRLDGHGDGIPSVPEPTAGPGTPPGAEAGRPWVIGYLARIAPEKGLHLLAAAYREVARQLGPGRVRLEVAGHLPARQRGYLRGVERDLAGWGLGAGYRYRGEVTRAEKIRFLGGLDVLAAPSPYPEPKGLYVLEALANGVPVVAPRHGAFPELLEETGGGVLVAPGDAGELAAALVELLQDPGRRQRLGRAGRAAVHARRGDAAMAAATLALYEGCVDGRDRPLPAARRRQPAAGLAVQDMGKSFRLGERELVVLRGVSFRLDAGETLAVVGPSGSGKSTLLHVLGTLERPTTGTVTLAGSDLYSLPEPALARLRNQRIGFVFQDHHLLPQYSVLENVLLPAQAFGRGSAAAQARATELLARVGLSERLGHRPAELSGGERQRAAIARALLHRPALLLCDEPTGSLDHATALAATDLLFELQREEAAMLVIATHSGELAARCARRLQLRDGQCFAA